MRAGYGYDYICTTQETGAPCKLVAAQARWVPRPPQINYADAIVLLRNGSSTTGLMYNRSSASAWFEYQDWDGKRHQVWSVPTMTLATDVTSTRCQTLTQQSFVLPLWLNPAVAVQA